MCDFSLHLVASRPATVGDKLVSTSFRNSITRGFATLGEPDVAVCLLPGTELAFDKEVTYGFLGLFSRRVEHRVARVRHINVDNPYVHHHALEFPDGRIVLLTQLKEGQKATVLQLPSRSVAGDKAERDRHPGTSITTAVLRS